PVRAADRRVRVRSPAGPADLLPDRPARPHHPRTGAGAAMTMTGYQPPNDPRPPAGPVIADTLAGIFRGVWAVICLITSAADALVSAVLGTPRMAPIGHRLGREIADEYRRGFHDAIDVTDPDDEDDVIDSDDQPDDDREEVA